MSFELKQQKTDLHPVSSGKSVPGKPVSKPSPVMRHHRAMGNQALQQKPEEEERTDFSDVNIIPNSPKAPSLGALAYTKGNDIHFAPGAYNPGSSKGKQLLGHELAHVVQQREGRVQPTTTVNGQPVNDHPALEKEADDIAKKLL